MNTGESLGDAAHFCGRLALIDAYRSGGVISKNGGQGISEDPFMKGLLEMPVFFERSENYVG